MTTLNETRDFLLEIEEKGAINVFDKKTKKQLSRISGLMFVNKKPVVINSKAMGADEFVRKFSADKIIKFEMEPVRQLTRETPEFLLLMPKGEKTKEIDGLIEHLKKKGFQAACDELPVTLKKFQDTARRIKEESSGGD